MNHALSSVKELITLITYQTPEQSEKKASQKCADPSSEKIKEQIIESINPLLSKVLNCEVRYLNMALEVIWSLSMKK